MEGKKGRKVWGRGISKSNDAKGKDPKQIKCIKVRLSISARTAVSKKRGKVWLRV